MTNREEVAKNLREAGERLDKEAPSNLTAAAYTTLFELLESAGIREGNSYSDVFSRLADLIDPTCSLTLDEELSQEVQGDMFRCNKCNAAFPPINGEYQYCPHCGARAVRDE